MRQEATRTRWLRPGATAATVGLALMAACGGGGDDGAEPSAAARDENPSATFEVATEALVRADTSAEPGAASTTTDDGPGLPTVAESDEAPAEQGAADDDTTSSTGPEAGGDEPAGSDDEGQPQQPTTPAPPPTTPRTGPEAQPGDRNDAFGGGGRTRCSIFPADNWWNEDISGLPVHQRSDAWVASIGDGSLHPDFGTVWDGKAIGIPYVLVDGDQPRVPVSFTYANESEPGPYPIPADAPIEDGSDRHVVVIDETNCVLYELFDAAPIDGGRSWQAVSGAVFDLGSNGLRPTGWTSADAAGLPIYPGLVTYEEVVVDGRIDHALRFTASRTQRAFIRPATHFASPHTDPNIPPMGARFRLRSDYDCSSYSTEIQVVCTALKTYGMFLADNGGDWHVIGSPDPRWDDSALRDLRSIPGSAFEVVETGEPLTD